LLAEQNDSPSDRGMAAEEESSVSGSGPNLSQWLFLFLLFFLLLFLFVVFAVLRALAIDAELTLHLMISIAVD